MGQKSSLLGGKTNKPKLPILWILRGDHTRNRHNPEQPIKFQYKTRRKKSPNVQKHPIINTNNNNNNVNISTNNSKINDLKCQKAQNAPLRAKSEPSLVPEKERHRRRRKPRNIGSYEKSKQIEQRFGYEIEDVDAFLTKATIDKPANIPVVLSFSTILYQTRTGGFQSEIQLPLGMVVNAVFKNQNWLYVQTPHTEEGYVNYAACLPLGIIPPPTDSPVPCWENSTDVFPKPSGNMTDTEKLSSRSECSLSRCHSRRSRAAYSSCGEKSVDRLYLQAAACAKIKGTKQTLLVVYCDYQGRGKNAISVSKGDVVVLVSSHLKGWFWIRNNHGHEGLIPSAVAGHGYL
ncbi:hypothetical protein RI129_006384 [Pyrocoelia pectoralis]|uniref:SH3 domain-containing protein n=1 Tax=Pyrocoelia pectoralis TaxID=417401 RepID=A0AAN7VF75_9COLE